MEIEDWESSSDGMLDSDVSSEDINEEEIHYTSGSMPKLQFRKDVSKARWNEEMGMAEVIEKKGKMWTTTGIVRKSKVYCSIEEILFLAEMGALFLLDADDMVISLNSIYERVAAGKSGCLWESFKAYKHLKSLGYIVGRHGVPWTLKSDHSFAGLSFAQVIPEDKGEPAGIIPIINQLNELQINEVKPIFDIYLPNSKFRKSSPGDPSFVLCLTRDHPPSKAVIENLERNCSNIPLKFYHVEHGRVCFFSFNKTELPVLP